MSKQLSHTHIIYRTAIWIQNTNNIYFYVSKHAHISSSYMKIEQFDTDFNPQANTKEQVFSILQPSSNTYLYVLICHSQVRIFTKSLFAQHLSVLHPTESNRSLGNSLEKRTMAYISYMQYRFLSQHYLWLQSKSLHLEKESDCS